MKKLLLLLPLLLAQPKTAPAAITTQKLAETSIDGNILRVRSLKSGRTATYRLDRINHRGLTQKELIERIERNGILFIR